MLVRALVATLIMLVVPLAGLASHLSEAEVEALEASCDEARAEKLAPKRAAVRKQCLAEGMFDAQGCEEMAQTYGERQFGAIRRPGLYYDLPVCVEAFRAREHYTLNPGR